MSKNKSIYDGLIEAAKNDFPFNVSNIHQLCVEIIAERIKGIDLTDDREKAALAYGYFSGVSDTMNPESKLNTGYKN